MKGAVQPFVNPDLTRLASSVLRSVRVPVLMAVIQTAEKLLPAGLRGKAEPFVRTLASLTAGNDPRTLAQRMALVTFAIRVASAAIAFITQIVLARVMGEFEYGVFVFAWALVVICGDMSCLGFHTTVVRFLPDYAGRNA